MYQYFDYDDIPAVVLMSTAPPIVAATMFDGENWIPASPASLMHNAEILNEAEWRTRFAKVLEKAGFIDDVRAESHEGHPALVMTIRYDDRGKPLIDGIRRVSKPGRRVYVGAREVWKVRNGLGISVISTSKGILSDTGAREASIGGEVVCEVW